MDCKPLLYYILKLPCTPIVSICCPLPLPPSPLRKNKKQKQKQKNVKTPTLKPSDLIWLFYMTIRELRTLVAPEL